MGPAKKTNEPAAEPNPKKRIKRTEKQEDKKNATTAVEAPDAADESVSTQMVNKFMKLKRFLRLLRLDVSSCFPPKCFAPRCFPAIYCPQTLRMLKCHFNCRYLFPHKVSVSTLCLLQVYRTLDNSKKLLAAVQSPWFDQFEVVWSIHGDTL